MHRYHLAQLPCGREARVLCLEHKGPLRQRLMDLGMVPGTRVHCVGRAPSGDPSAYAMRGMVLALRRADAEQIQVEEVES